MPIGALLRLNLTTVADPQTVWLGVSVRARNADITDFVELSLTVTHELADAVAASWRLFGLTVEMDDGAGLQVVPLGQLGPRVSVRGSLDGYGRQASFSRFLPSGGPLVSDLLCGMRHVRITGYMGVSPATMQARVIFDGYILSATFNGSPPVADITCQDASILWAETKLTLDIPEGSGRTRQDIGTEIMNRYGLPYGAVDFGPSGGGIVRKAMQVGGDQNLLDWFRGFITPLGLRLRFNTSGRLEIGAFDETTAVVRTYLVKDVAQLSIVPPSTINPNRVSMTGTAVVLSATALTASGADGTLSSGMVVTTVLDMREYIPQVAVKIQDHGTGVITDHPTPPLAHSPFTTQTTTATTIDIVPSGDTSIVTVTEAVDVYAYYAQSAAQFKIANSAGDLTFNDSFDVFLFQDGSAHRVDAESFQHVSSTQTVKQYIQGTLRRAEITIGKWDPHAEIPFAGGVFTSGLVTAQRERWPNGYDSYEPLVSQTTTIYEISTDGVHLASAFQTVVKFAGSGSTVFSDYIYRNTGDPASGQLAETLASSSHAQQIDNLQKAVQDPQTLTAIVTDTRRVGLTTLVVSQQQNDFCENVAELRTASFFLLRDMAKTFVPFQTPVDLTVTDGSVFNLPIPKVGAGARPILCGDFEITVEADGQGRVRDSQKITGWWYPPNLSAA